MVMILTDVNFAQEALSKLRRSHLPSASLLLEKLTSLPDGGIQWLTNVSPNLQGEHPVILLLCVPGELSFEQALVAFEADNTVIDMHQT